MTDIVDRLNDSLSAGYSELRKEAAVEIVRLRAEVEAAEKKVAYIKEVEFPRKMRAVAVGWETKCARLEQERDALQAKVEAMEQQKPVAWARKIGLDVPSFGCVTDLKYRPSDIPESSYIPLYTNPCAQPAPSIPEGWKLVPIEPTPGMIDAAEYVDWGDADVRGSCINAWDRMLAAAPEVKS